MTFFYFKSSLPSPVDLVADDGDLITYLSQGNSDLLQNWIIEGSDRVAYLSADLRVDMSGAVLL